MKYFKTASHIHVSDRFGWSLHSPTTCKVHHGQIWGRYHGGRRPSSDDSFHSPTVIPPSALDKPSIMKRYHRRRTCSHTSSRCSQTMVTLHDTRFVEFRGWNDGWAVKTVVTRRSSASMLPALAQIVVRAETEVADYTCYFIYRLVGLVVKASAYRPEDPGFESHLRRDFSGSSHISDLKLALQWLPCQPPGFKRVNAGTGPPGVSIL